jgi:hypothetical protein
LFPGAEAAVVVFGGAELEVRPTGSVLKREYSRTRSKEYGVGQLGIGAKTISWIQVSIVKNKAAPKVSFVAKMTS